MATKTRPRLWRYEVDEVWGDAPVIVGTVLIDKWKVPATWTVINLNTGKTVSGWHAKRLGEVTGDVAESVYKSWGLADTFKPTDADAGRCESCNGLHSDCGDA